MASVVCAGCWVMCSASEYDISDETAKYLNEHKHAVPFLCQHCVQCGIRVKTIYERNVEQMMHKTNASDKPNESQVIAGLKAQKSIMNDNKVPQVLHFILSQLPVADLCRLSSVCREWHKVALTNQLWKHFCHRDEINLQDVMDNVPDEQQSLRYKTLYMKYMITLKKWTTGKGVTIFSKPLKTPAGADFHGNCLAITSDYMFARLSRTIYVFAASTGEYSHQLKGLPAHSGDCSFIVSENGTKAAAYASSTSFIFVWNVQSAECMHTLQHPAEIAKMIMHADMLAVTLDASFGSGVYLWSMESGQLLHQLQGVHRADVLAMDDQHFATFGKESMVVQLWDVNTGSHLFTWTHTDNIDVTLMDAATNSLVGIGDGHVNVPAAVWDMNTGIHRATIRSTPQKYLFGQLIHKGKFVIAYSNWAPDGMGSIEVVDLKNCADVLTSVNFCPTVYWNWPMHIHVHMHVLSSALLVVARTVNDYVSVDVWDMRKRQFIRRINVGGGRQEGPIKWRGDLVRRVHASFKQLLVMLQENDLDDSKRSYKKFDFGP